MAKHSVRLHDKEEDELARLTSERGVLLRDLLRAALYLTNYSEDGNGRQKDAGALLIQAAEEEARIEGRKAGEKQGLTPEDVQQALWEHGSKNAAAKALNTSAENIRYHVNKNDLEVPSDT